MSEISAKHISDVIGLLNDNADYAVLRNFEGLPDNNKSRDIDIIITRKSYVALKSELLKLIDSSGWKSSLICIVTGLLHTCAVSHVVNTSNWCNGISSLIHLYGEYY